MNVGQQSSKSLSMGAVYKMLQGDLGCGGFSKNFSTEEWGGWWWWLFKLLLLLLLKLLKAYTRLFDKKYGVWVPHTSKTKGASWNNRSRIEGYMV